ncbi:response regulator transcription factor [Ferruginibacter yonginensis]|uniref:Response regulator transcription factor n=1 Tax=Ferruginibacter yonginensis TaxID=1310416 RepID=A0ABV8QT98_9BACT
MSTKATILFAEDDASLAFMVKDSLEDEGYKVVHFADGQSAIDQFDKNKFDLCLLDIMMPNKDGYMVAKKVRQQSDLTPILFLSTKSQEEDRLKGYDKGADDYIAKPFSMPELLKKIEVFLKRSKKMHAETATIFHINNLVFSPIDLKISTATAAFNITQKEADLLRFLCEHQNKVVKRDEVLLHVWGKDDYFLGRSMDVYMTKLRKYLKVDPEVIIETIHGVGFRLVVPTP